MELLVQMPVTSTSTVPILKDYSTFILRSYRVHPTIPIEYSNALVYAPTWGQRHVKVLALRNESSHRIT